MSPVLSNRKISLFLYHITGFLSQPLRHDLGPFPVHPTPNLQLLSNCHSGTNKLLEGRCPHRCLLAGVPRFPATSSQLTCRGIKGPRGQKAPIWTPGYETRQHLISPASFLSCKTSKEGGSNPLKTFESSNKATLTAKSFLQNRKHGSIINFSEPKSSYL